jgi:hypothetical protein
MSNHFNPEKVIDFNIDYFAVLGLEKGSLPAGINRKEREEITQILNAAYRKEAFKTHPDFAKNQEHKDLLNEKFKLVVRAHTILSNPLYREYYESGGEVRPVTVEDGNDMQVDWSKVGTFREGMLEDTIGSTLFLDICKKEDLGLIPAFKPSEEAHNFEWDWVIEGVNVRPGEATKLALSCVNDESDVLRLSSVDKIKDSLPFKIYICIPRAALHFLREETKEYNMGETSYKLNGSLKAAIYSDINLLETTSLEEAKNYINNILENDLSSLKDGSLLQRQKDFDIQQNQSQWLSTDQIKDLDTQRLKAILLSKTFHTKRDEKAADFITNIPDTAVRKKARYQR